MAKPIKILIGIFVLFVLALSFKAFYINRPRLSPELTAEFYFQHEQFGSRREAEKLFIEPLSQVKIFGKSYIDFKIESETKNVVGVEFTVKEVETDNESAKVILTERIFGETYFLNFFLSEEYHPKGEIKFEVILTKVGDFAKGYEWKIVKINSPTLLRHAEKGEGVDVKTNVSAKIDDIKCEIVDKCVITISFENKSFKNYNISSKEWKIIDIEGNEIIAEVFEKKLEPSEKIKKDFVFKSAQKTLPTKIIMENKGKKIIWQL